MAGGPAAGKERESRRKPESPSNAASAGAGQTALVTEAEDLAPLTEIQERTLRRTQLLKLKAEAELERLEKAPARRGREGASSPSGKDASKDAGAAKPKPIDPKQVKAGYQKAIELAPRAVDRDGTCGQVAQTEKLAGCLSPRRGGT